MNTEEFESKYDLRVVQLSEKMTIRFREDAFFLNVLTLDMSVTIKLDPEECGALMTFMKDFVKDGLESIKNLRETDPEFDEYFKNNFNDLLA